MLLPVLPKILLPNSACARVAWKMIVAGTKLRAYSPTINQDQGFPLAKEHSARTSFVFHSLTRLPERASKSSMDQVLLLLGERDAVCSLRVCFYAVLDSRGLLLIYDLRPTVLHRPCTSRASVRLQEFLLSADPSGRCMLSGIQGHAHHLKLCFPLALKPLQKPLDAMGCFVCFCFF